jgi:cobalt-zinc-cadmium efflux system outer membrane protein
VKPAVVLVVLGLLASPTAAQTPVAPVTLAELEQLALRNNPTSQQAQSAVDAARGRARQAGSFPNPIVGYSAQEVTNYGDVDPRGQYGFFVEQTIPLGGKLKLGREVFDREAQAAETRVDLQRNRILSSVRSAFYAVLAADRRVNVQERLAALAAEAVDITAQLFNVGAADRPDYLESQVAARRAQLALNAARNQAFALRRQLSSVVGQDLEERPLAGSIDEAIPELERDATVRRLVEESPQMRAGRAEVERTMAVTARARRATFPDLFVRGGAAYNREHGVDTRRPIGWEAAVETGISIPLFNRNQGGVLAAQAEETSARADLHRVELSLRARAAAEFATYITSLGAAEAYRMEILPQSEEAYMLYLARYREMGAAYPQVLAAQRNLFEVSADYLTAVDAAWRSAIRLQGLLAGDALEAPDAMSDSGNEAAALVAAPARER